MKKIIIILILSIFTLGVNAQNYIGIKASQLPQKTIAFFKKNLVTYTLDSAAKSEENGIIKYAVVAETRGRKAVYVFDKDGKFLRREKDMKALEQPKPTPPVTPTKK